MEPTLALDAAINRRDTSQIAALLSDDVVIHHDGITMGEDVKGKDAAVRWFDSYFSRYSFASHDVIAAAADEGTRSSFSFYMDQGVKRKTGEAAGTNAPEGDVTVGMWHNIFNSDLKISGMYFLRQLSHDEMERKLHRTLDQEVKFNPLKYKPSAFPPSPELQKCHKAAAQEFDDMWRTGDPAPAQRILADAVSIYDPVLGHEKHGRKSFEEMIQRFAQEWTIEQHESHIAATPDDKAFVWWRSTGKLPDGSQDTLYGMNMLVWGSDDDRVHDIIGFRQLTKGESEKFVKPDRQRH
jgi:ketosteroid isomerase-like protein